MPPGRPIRGGVPSVALKRLALFFVASASVFSAIVPTGAHAASATTPKRLYRALLTTAYPGSQLPIGFFSTKVSPSAASKQARTYHVVGEVQVAVNGPDPADEIFYYVFPNATDARGDLAHTKLVENLHLTPVRMPSYPTLPSHMYAGSITGQNGFGTKVTYGFTVAFVAKGNLIVGAFTDSADNTESGNVPAALDLLKAALRHLTILQTALARHRGK